MSLCPLYCDCRSCKHGVKYCEWCTKCAEARERREQQAQHEASVRRQKARLKIMPWAR